MTTTDEKFNGKSPWELFSLARHDPSIKPDVAALKFAVTDYKIFLLKAHSILQVTYPIGHRIEWKFYPMSDRKPENHLLQFRDLETICSVQSFHDNPARQCLRELEQFREIFEGEKFESLSMDLEQFEFLDELKIVEFPRLMLTMEKSEEHLLRKTLKKVKVGEVLSMVVYDTEGSEEKEEESPPTSDPFTHLTSISSSGLNAFLKAWISSQDIEKRRFSMLTPYFLEKDVILEGFETKPFDEEIDYYSFHYTPTPANAVKITREDGISATVVINNVRESENYFVFFVDGAAF